MGFTYTKNIREPWLNNANYKGKAHFIFLCDPQKSSRSSANVCLMKKLKSTVIKKVIVCFCHFCEENFGKFQLLYIIFPTFNMVLFEIHQRFKRQLLNKLRVSSKKSVKVHNFCNMLHEYLIIGVPKVSFHFFVKLKIEIRNFNI